MTLRTRLRRAWVRFLTPDTEWAVCERCQSDYLRPICPHPDPACVECRSKDMDLFLAQLRASVG